MEILNIKHEKFEAKISLKGAQLLSFRPTGKTDVLWCCDEEFFEDNKPIRGGVPICWPWFGSKNGISHGFARDLQWSLCSKIENQDGVKLEFILSSNEITKAIWEFDFNAKVIMNLSDHCELWFETDCEQATQVALHTYLRVDNVYDIEILGLGNTYIDKLQSNTIYKTDNSILCLTKAHDSIYTYPENNTKIINRKSGKTVEIIHIGNSDVVLWNPWADGEKKLKELKDGDFKNFVCVETACVTKDFFGKIGFKISL